MEVNLRSIWVHNSVKLSKTGPKLSKTGPELSKTGHKLSKTQSNGRVNLRNRLNRPGSALEAGLTVCSHTPRFSYDGPKTTIPSSNDGSTGGAGRGCTRRGMGTGWVLGGCYTGTTHPASCSRREGPTQRSGPRKPCKGWSGWGGAWTDVPGTAAGTAPGYHPSGPVGPHGPSLYPGP